MSILLGLGLLVLRRTYFSELITGSRHSRRRGTVDEQTRAVQRRSLGGPFGAVIGKDLLCFWRDPLLIANLGSYIVIANGLGLLLVSRLPGLDASLRPGLVLFAAGVLSVLRLATLLRAGVRLRARALRELNIPGDEHRWVAEAWQEAPSDAHAAIQ